MTTTDAARERVGGAAEVAPAGAVLGATWLAALVVGLGLHHGLGGALAAPSLVAPSQWPQWASSRDAVTVAFVVLRLSVIALAWYLVGVTTVGVLARLTRAARLVLVADAVTVPAVRRLLQNALGLGLAAVVVGTATAGPASLPRSGVGGSLAAGAALAVEATSQPVAPPGLEPPVGPLPGPPTEPAAGSVPDDPVDAERRVAEPAPGVEVERAGMGPGVDAEPTGARWEVVAGDHLWSIAAHVLADAWDRRPRDAEVVGYWQDLIETNHHALADPTNPDLIYPGQVFVLPTAPPRPDDR